MAYLSKELEARLKIKGKNNASLIEKQHSCGIFQDYTNYALYQKKGRKK